MKRSPFLSWTIIRLFREGIRNVLDSEKDIEVVAETTNGDEGLELVRDLLPMVALIDVNLPSMNGIQVTRQIVAERISTAIVLLTAYDDVEQVLHAFKAGAAAYCSKDVEPGKLVDVIRNVARRLLCGWRSSLRPGRPGSMAFARRRDGPPTSSRWRRRSIYAALSSRNGDPAVCHPRTQQQGNCSPALESAIRQLKIT